MERGGCAVLGVRQTARGVRRHAGVVCGAWRSKCNALRAAEGVLRDWCVSPIIQPPDLGRVELLQVHEARRLVGFIDTQLALIPGGAGCMFDERGVGIHAL